MQKVPATHTVEMDRQTDRCRIRHCRPGCYAWQAEAETAAAAAKDTALTLRAEAMEDRAREIKAQEGKPGPALALPCPTRFHSDWMAKCYGSTSFQMSNQPWNQQKS
jgi:hypothetical protein